MLIIPNTAVLMFPGWFRAGKDAPRGIEATGQRLIFSIGQLAVFMVCIVPAAIIFATIFVLSNFLVTPIFSVPTAAAAAALIMAVEVWLGVMFLGRLFEKFDISSDAES
jgi:cytochrome b subunit of formate dehydrogenase